MALSEYTQVAIGCIGCVTAAPRQRSSRDFLLKRLLLDFNELFYFFVCMLLFNLNNFGLTFGKPGQPLVAPSKAVKRLRLARLLYVFFDKQLNQAIVLSDLLV